MILSSHVVIAYSENPELYSVAVLLAAVTPPPAYCKTYTELVIPADGQMILPYSALFPSDPECCPASSRRKFSTSKDKHMGSEQHGVQMRSIQKLIQKVKRSAWSFALSVFTDSFKPTQDFGVT